ncbi:MAG: helix-turn-helix domain-containing protein [Lactobacillaceae bacterium]|jgi:predicted transcriptional regulator|nr:helix-turn-helix domain-containing protein [Lactobacillaceae bacterium]
MKSKIHIGKLIRQKVEQRSLSITEFAKLINRSRSDVYYIYDCESIDIALLLQISDVLDFDFIEKYYCNSKTKTTEFEYVLLTFLQQEELPDTLPEKSVLLKKQNK